jgi:hypothetical protein
MADADLARAESAAASLAGLGEQPDTAAILQRPGCPIIHEGGLSSAEGLGFRIRDARETGRARPAKGEEEGKPIMDPGEPDKRLLIVQSEFGAVLRMGRRDGNVLSEGLRAFWDGHFWGPLVKRDRYGVTRPHVNIVANITIEELRELLDSCAFFNGFANRFLWPYVERARFLPRPPRLDIEELLPFAVRLRKAVLDARGRVYAWTPSAAKQWDELYHYLEDRGLRGRPALSTERASPYTARLAMLYAALDSAPAIDTVHLDAATAAWAYAEDSAVYIFGAGPSLPTDVAHAIEIARRNGGAATVRDIQQSGPASARKSTDAARALCQRCIDLEAARPLNGSTVAGRPLEGIQL